MAELNAFATYEAAIKSAQEARDAAIKAVLAAVMAAEKAQP